MVKLSDVAGFAAQLDWQSLTPPPVSNDEENALEATLGALNLGGSGSDSSDDASTFDEEEQLSDWEEDDSTPCVYCADDAKWLK
jgi:hypothetical protein